MRDHSTSSIAISDCRIRLMRGGAGAPLLFLHGGGGIGIWLPSMARLAKKFEVIAPEHGTPGDVVGAAYLAVRVIAPSGRAFCDLSDLDIDAQTVAAARLPGPCSYLLIPGAGRSLLSPELERAAGPSTQLIASRSAGRLAQGFSPTVLRTDQEGTITLPM